MPIIIYHFQESLHRATKLGLLNLQLRQQVDEPLKRSLIAVNPEEIDLAQVHDRRWNL